MKEEKESYREEKREDTKENARLMYLEEKYESATNLKLPSAIVLLFLADTESKVK